MLNILYEDNHIIVVLKPHNVPSQEDSSGDLDMLTMVKNYIKESKDKPGEAYVGLVHRLDRPTGGVMVFAKTSKAAERLSEQIREREFEKTYLAVVSGKPRQPRAHLTHYLRKSARDNTVEVVPQTIEGAKKAELEYRVIDTIGDFSLLEVKLFTGRSHQIRVQLKTIGHPIVNDAKYGNVRSGSKMALWAFDLKLVHPTTKLNHTFKAYPDKDEKPWSTFLIDQL